MLYFYYTVSGPLYAWSVCPVYVLITSEKYNKFLRLVFVTVASIIISVFFEL